MKYVKTYESFSLGEYLYLIVDSSKEFFVSEKFYDSISLNKIDNLSYRNIDHLKSNFLAFPDRKSAEKGMKNILTDRSDLETPMEKGRFLYHFTNRGKGIRTSFREEEQLQLMKIFIGSYEVDMDEPEEFEEMIGEQVKSEYYFEQAHIYTTQDEQWVMRRYAVEYSPRRNIFYFDRIENLEDNFSSYLFENHELHDDDNLIFDNPVRRDILTRQFKTDVPSDTILDAQRLPSEIEFKDLKRIDMNRAYIRGDQDDDYINIGES